MRGVVALDRGVRAPVFRRALRCLLLPGTAVVTLLGSQSAFAQQSPTSSASGASTTTPLPEIRVIATTPVAPPPRRAAAGATGAPAESAAATSQAAASQPGVVDQDKIPSNVQSVGASA